MFEFSSKTQVNKNFRLIELNKAIGADKTVKTDEKNIVKIVLTNVISNNTMNFTEDSDVKEIYIFEITLSEKIIPIMFISALDKSINLQTIFILKCNEEQMLYGAYKENSAKGIRIGKYYGTNWDIDNKYIPLPLSVRTVEDIYTALIDILIPIEAHIGEKSKDLAARYDQILKLQKDIDRLQKAVDREIQSKKRFELNQQLRQLKAVLEEII